MCYTPNIFTGETREKLISSWLGNSWFLTSLEHKQCMFFQCTVDVGGHIVDVIHTLTHNASCMCATTCRKKFTRPRNRLPHIPPIYELDFHVSVQSQNQSKILFRELLYPSDSTRFQISEVTIYAAKQRNFLHRNIWHIHNLVPHRQYMCKISLQTNYVYFTHTQFVSHGWYPMEPWEIPLCWENWVSIRNVARLIGEAALSGLG